MVLTGIHLIRFRGSSLRLLACVGLTSGVLLTALYWSDLCLNQAERCLSDRQTESASRWIDRSLWFWRKPDARTCLAELRIARRLENYAVVSAKLQAAAQLGVPHFEIERQRWLAMAQTGQYSLMEGHWIDLLQDPRDDEPEISRAYLTWSLSTYRLELVPQVLELWRADYPHDAEPWAFAGRYYEMIEDWKNAEKAYRSAVELEPKNDDYLLHYAKALQSAGNSKQAIRAYQDYLNRHPDDHEAARGLAHCYADHGDLTESLTLLKQAAEASPDDYATLSLYGKTLYSAGQSEAAATILDKAHRAAPEDASVANQLACALKALGRGTEAEPLIAFVAVASPELDRKFKLEKDLLRQPKNIDLRMQIAEITSKYVSRHEAIGAYQVILQLAPHYVPAHKALAELYRQVGDLKRADFHAAFPTRNQETNRSPPAESSFPRSDRRRSP